MARYNDKGQEIPDNTPVVLPVNVRPQSEIDRMRQMIRGELSRAAAEQGAETFEEANDFEVDEDDDREGLSPYQVAIMVEEHRELTNDPDGDTIDGERGNGAARNRSDDDEGRHKAGDVGGSRSGDHGTARDVRTDDQPGEGPADRASVARKGASADDASAGNRRVARNRQDE